MIRGRYPIFLYTGTMYSCCFNAV